MSLPRVEVKRQMGRGDIAAVSALLDVAESVDGHRPLGEHQWLDLVQGGRQLGIDEFLLVQWLAPVSSESPELLVAAVLALRGHQDSALGTLLSAKVNQWTLLVGSLPIAYAIGGGGAGGIALDARQTEEFILTAAQTVLGFAVLADLHLHLWEAIALLALFALQFPFPQTQVRIGFAIAYAALALVLLVWRRRELPRIARYASCSSSASTGSKLS